MKKLLVIAFVCSIFQFTSAQQLPYSVKDIKPILVGGKVPNTKITLSKGNDINTKKLFKQKQTVLVVYRGGWCPFCNNQLSGLGAIKDELVDMGYQIVAVSPDSNSNEKSSKYNAKDYIIASDSSMELIRNLGIAYKAPGLYYSVLKKASSGLNTNVIPAPSVYILNKKSEILFEHISTNYKKRLNAELLLMVAKGYKE